MSKLNRKARAKIRNELKELIAALDVDDIMVCVNPRINKAFETLATMTLLRGVAQMPANQLFTKEELRLSAAYHVGIAKGLDQGGYNEGFEAGVRAYQRNIESARQPPLPIEEVRYNEGFEAGNKVGFQQGKIAARRKK